MLALETERMERLLERLLLKSAAHNSVRKPLTNLSSTTCWLPKKLAEGVPENFHGQGPYGYAGKRNYRSRRLLTAVPKIDIDKQKFAVLVKMLSLTGVGRNSSKKLIEQRPFRELVKKIHTKC